ncbi:MAG: hypothetical protein R3C68_06895 [Myxococcota bacterium]
MNDRYSSPSYTLIGRVALAVAGIGVVAAVFGVISAPAAFFSAYLMAYLFCVGLSVGSLMLLMLHHLVAGRWGFTIQRALEGAVSTLPLMALLFVPLPLGVHVLYHWSHAQSVATDTILQHKQAFLNVDFWVIRAALYLLVWNIFAWLLLRRPQRSHLPVLSGPALAAMVVTVSFASIDWAMSLDPHWFSSIYGLVFVVGHALSALALIIVLLPLLRKNAAFAELLTKDRLHELGKLLFAFVMLWAYLNISQYLIIWMGNLPEEISWYVYRTTGGWQAIALAVIFLHFVVPFGLLLSRRVKRSLRLLVPVAALVLGARGVDLFWLLRPSAEHATPTFHWLDVVLPLTLVSLWLSVFLWRTSRHTAVPKDDPRMLEAFSHVH